MIIMIDVEYKDGFGTVKRFTTVVGSVQRIHEALMDCIREIDEHGLGYINHTITFAGKEQDND